MPVGNICTLMFWLIVFLLLGQHIRRVHWTRGGVCFMFGKVLSITPKFVSTLQLSWISSFTVSETRAPTLVDRPWYLRVNITEPELSRRWALTALIFSVESGLKRMPCRIVRLRALIVCVCVCLVCVLSVCA